MIHYLSLTQAAKISEAVYGKDDQRSNQAYEKFSYIYAEAGKIQYNGRIKKDLFACLIGISPC